MSNDLIPANVQLPAYLQGRVSKTASAMSLTAEAKPRISIEGKMWKFIKDGNPTVYDNAVLTVVILGVDPPAAKATSKVFYINTYVPGTDAAPDCSSDDGLFPSAHIATPQHSNCTQCPQNIWGSAKSKVTGEDAKACRDGKTLFVVAPNAVGSGTVFALRLPPTSFKALTEYGRSLLNRGIPVEGVITELRFAQVAHPQLTFSFGGFLPEDAANASIARAESAEIQALLHYPPTQAPVHQAPVHQAPVHQAPVHQAPVHQATIAADPWATAAPTQHAPAQQVVAQQYVAPVQQAPANPASIVTGQVPYHAAAASTGATVNAALSNAATRISAVLEPQAVASAPGGFRDAAGVTFNPDLHATGRDGKPSILSDGTFRKRRGTTSAAPQVQQAPVQQAPAYQAPVAAPVHQAPAAAAPTSDIGDILKAWG